MTRSTSSNEKKLPQPGDFARHWRVVAGDIGHTDPSQEPDRKYYAVLVYEAGEDTFQLFSQKEENGIVGEMVWRQNLHYNPETGTLESFIEPRMLERSISFWPGGGSSGRPDCIYAMRKAGLEGLDPTTIEETLLPWEYRKEPGDDGEILVATPYGAWGAEGG
ncbi:MAG: hypothetical protein SX243_11365 [Acidobacteriota bacterium]|nr:hypothetical protein [Acidobacteriota bacterium]